MLENASWNILTFCYISQLVLNKYTDEEARSLQENGLQRTRLHMGAITLATGTSARNTCNSHHKELTFRRDLIAVMGALRFECINLASVPFRSRLSAHHVSVTECIIH